ncbi:MAG: 1-acyl-sn-glycerol-3-phosphate acyltransferase [Polyangiaceae bacterium]|nr:1-acyl-sn-glycerol-3-phosphate acyltransferase [Polyangiaceae bacterium]
MQLAGAGSLHAELEDRIERLEIPWNRFGYDPYGASKRHLVRTLLPFCWAYRHYFGVRVHGIANVPARGRAMLVGNHSGGIALDAAMVIAAMLLELDPPRLAHGMADRFLSRWPFLAVLAQRCGQMTGLPEHAERLLEAERLLLVFPEGAHGTEKLYRQRYSLVDFGTGFVRLALAAKAPIVPFAFLGGGEAIPTVANAYKLGRRFGAPYLPVTPWVLPLPLPVRLDIHFGEPVVLGGTGDEDDEVVAAHVERVKLAIAGLIAHGKRVRRVGATRGAGATP